MTKKVAINGFGRIGRLVFRHLFENFSSEVEIVALNDLTDTKTLAHLLKHDSNYGLYPRKIDFDSEHLIIDGRKFRVFSDRDPEKLPWRDLEVDLVLECTGVFRHFEGASKHLKAGAKRVIISAPAKSKNIPSFVLGVNANQLDPQKDLIVDMGSCTTNCLAPICKVLHENFGIEKGFMTTVHSYTNDQRILDLPHKDLRRARAAALNIIPTTTGAAKAIGKVIPDLEGKLDGIAVRVPTPTVSFLDLICLLKKEVSLEGVIQSFKSASQSEPLKGILAVEEDELVSGDFKATEYSSIVDLPLVRVNGNLVKISAWYDNEWAYARRLAEFTCYYAEKI